MIFFLPGILASWAALQLWGRTLGSNLPPSPSLVSPTRSSSPAEPLKGAETPQRFSLRDKTLATGYAALSTVLWEGVLKRPEWGLPFQDILQWKESRTFFYWRLRRLLLEEGVKAEILSAHSELSNSHIQSMIRRWFLETEGAVKVRDLVGGSRLLSAAPASRLSVAPPFCLSCRVTCGITIRWRWHGWKNT